MWVGTVVALVAALVAVVVAAVAAVTQTLCLMVRTAHPLRLLQEPHLVMPPSGLLRMLLLRPLARPPPPHPPTLHPHYGSPKVELRAAWRVGVVVLARRLLAAVVVVVAAAKAPRAALALLLTAPALDVGPVVPPAPGVRHRMLVLEAWYQQV